MPVFHVFKPRVPLKENYLQIVSKIITIIIIFKM